MTDKHKIKANVTLSNGENYWGYFYTDKEERIQDLLNDARTFIPFHRLVAEKSHREDYYSMIMIHKDSVVMVEPK